MNDDISMNDNLDHEGGGLTAIEENYPNTPTGITQSPTGISPVPPWLSSEVKH